MGSNYRIFNNKLERKSQITLFLIAGFLILITIVAIFYVTEYVKRERISAELSASEEFKKDVESINNYVERCVRDIGYNGLLLLGQQGGYIDIPDVIKHEGKSYWYLDQINIQPTLDEIRERLSNHVNSNVPKCSDFDVFRERGFEIESENVSSLVEFGTETVFIGVTYPITVRRGDFEEEIEYFYENYDIRFRRIYEMASQINYRHFNPYFDVYHPLELVYSLDFELSNIPYTDDRIVYTIVDRTRFEYGVNNYTFRFVAKFGNSELPRKTMLWANSAYVPNPDFFIVYSVDRMARLFVMPEVLINLKGKSVDEITTRQYYPDGAKAFDIVYSGEADQGVSSSKKHDRSWKLTNPVYSFEPTGTRFSYPLPMFFYWDDEVSPNKGEVGILYTNGSGWHPIDSNPVYNESYVWATAYGFSNYTVIDCGEQENQTHSAESTIKPKWPCFVLLVINIYLIVISVGAILSATSMMAALRQAALGFALGFVINMAVNFVLNSIFPPPNADVSTTRIPPVFLYPREGTALAEGHEAFLNEARGTTLAGRWSNLKERAIGLVKGLGGTGIGKAVKGAGDTAWNIAKPIVEPVMGVGKFVRRQVGNIAGSIKNKLFPSETSKAIAESNYPESLSDSIAGSKSKGLPEKLGTSWSNIGNMVAFSAFTWVLARFSYDSKINCIEFTPTCDQYIKITKKDSGGSGKCTLSSGWYEGGHTYQVCAVVKKCNKLKKFVCQKCSTTCTVTFR